MNELHYTVQQLAKIWRLSEDKIRGLFDKEEGVVRITERKKGVRQYVTLRIPESIAQRVYKKLTNCIIRKVA
jgi:hypothetical protein